MSAQQGLLAVMARDATDAQILRARQCPAVPHSVRVQYRRESDNARAAVKRLLAADEALDLAAEELNAAFAPFLGEHAGDERTDAQRTRLAKAKETLAAAKSERAAALAQCKGGTA